MFIDAHCHLTHAEFTKDVDEVIVRAKAAGVAKMYCTSGAKGDGEKILQLCSAHQEIRAVIGIDPHLSVNLTKEEIEAELRFIEKNHRKIAAIGEIGLDYHHFTDEKQRVKQISIFTEQLELARTLDLPTVIHSRKAEQKIVEFLIAEKFKNFMMHCFLVKDIAVKAAAYGAVISLPTLKSKNRKYIMKNVPLENILCETDSPYLWKEGRNEPANVVEVYNELSAVRGEKVEKIAEQVKQNAENFFK